MGDAQNWPVCSYSPWVPLSREVGGFHREQGHNYSLLAGGLIPELVACQVKGRGDKGPYAAPLQRTVCVFLTIALPVTFERTQEGRRQEPLPEGKKKNQEGKIGWETGQENGAPGEKDHGAQRSLNSTLSRSNLECR